MITLGVDEVGRGCWAGPVVAGAVILSSPIAGLADSKRLSKRKRAVLAAEIQMTAAWHSLGWASSQEVDLLGLSAAVRLAMARAVSTVSRPYDVLIIDGNINYLKDNPKARAIIKADASVAAVSAASILAKVARDNYMAEQALNYPGYRFGDHVGYGTAAHWQALMTYGICPLHRTSVKPVQAAARTA